MNGHSVARAQAPFKLANDRILERGARPAQLEPFAAAQRAMELGERFFLWQSPDRSRSVFGAGELLRLGADGRDRLEALSAVWNALDLTGAPHALLLGGFAFDCAAPAGAFQGMRAADFFVPKVLWRRDGAAERVYFLDIAQGAAWGDGSGHEELLAGLRARPTSVGGAVRLVDLPGTARAWRRRVSAATEEIRRGTFQKVVLARQRLCLYDRPPALGGVLGALSAQEADCALFALGDGRRVFLGATPELLCRREREVLHVDCLAGTAARGGDAASDERSAQALLRSAKNRLEHAYVFDAIMEALRGLGLSPSAPREPRVRRLHHLQHLFTPVSCTARHIDLLRIAASLHPTPAMGGRPRDAALRWLRENEGIARGFYSGAVGFVDTSGDGEFEVAIRSGVLGRRGGRLFAGCGIVSGSEPFEELRETEVKLRPLSSALRGER